MDGQLEHLVVNSVFSGNHAIEGAGFCCPGDDPTLIEIDLFSRGPTVRAVSHGKLLEGRNFDSRGAISIGPDGCVYAVVRADNATGFGGQYLHHLTRFDPTTKAIEDLGYHYIELDVRMSADRVPVIIHDPTLERTTTYATHINPDTSAAQNFYIGCTNAVGAGWMVGYLWRPRILSRATTGAEHLAVYEIERGLFGV